CERPRERLFANGTASLTDAELLAVILCTGVRGASALDIARGLLTQHRNLTGVLSAFAKKPNQRSGVGPAKIAQLKAGIELARRRTAHASAQAGIGARRYTDARSLRCGGQSRRVVCRTRTVMNPDAGSKLCQRAKFGGTFNDRSLYAQTVQMDD